MNMCTLILAAFTAHPMFVGDSITHQSRYLGYLRLYQALYEPNRRVEMINGGLCGDSAANATERWQRDVLKFPADEYFVMLGMNDFRSQYYESFEPDAATQSNRVAAIERYREKYGSLCRQAKATGKRVTLMTPTPVDTFDAKKRNHASKNEVGLAKCSEIVRGYAAEYGFGLIELHRNLCEFLKDHRAEIDYSSDSCHPNLEGGLLVATEIVEQLGMTNEVGHIRMRGEGKYVYMPKAMPFPATEEWKHLVAARPKTAALNREILEVEGLVDSKKYSVSVAGREVGRFRGRALKAGVNIAELDTPSQRRAMEAERILRKIIELDDMIRDIYIIDIHYCRSGKVEDLDRLLAGKQGKIAPFRKWAKNWKEHRAEKTQLCEQLSKLIDELYAAVQPRRFIITVKAVN